VSNEKREQVARLEPQWKRLEPYLQKKIAAASVTPTTLRFLQGVFSRHFSRRLSPTRYFEVGTATQTLTLTQKPKQYLQERP